MHISSEKSMDYVFLKSMEDTFIHLYVYFLDLFYFLQKGVLEMLKQPERESRNVNDFFYEMEGRQIQKMNKVLEGVELTKADERTLIWLAGWEESTVDNLLSVIKKAARIRENKKGGYAHKSKCKSEK